MMLHLLPPDEDINKTNIILDDTENRFPSFQSKKSENEN